MVRTTLGTLAGLVAASGALAQATPGPERGSDEGEGPFERLIIRGATVIDGAGAPPTGPVDIVIEGNRIAEVETVGYPGVPIDEERRPTGATRDNAFTPKTSARWLRASTRKATSTASAPRVAVLEVSPWNSIGSLPSN
jgi:hypothetical protein